MSEDLFENQLLDLFGIDSVSLLRQAIRLTILCFLISVVEITLLAFKYVNPRINKENSSQSFDTTKKNFICLVRSTFATAKEQHRRDLLLYFEVYEINTNNYSDEEREKFRNGEIATNVREFDKTDTEAIDTNQNKSQDSMRELGKIAIDTRPWINEALNRGGKTGYSKEFKNEQTPMITKEQSRDLKEFKNEQTPMMEFINHLIKVHAIATLVQQFHIGLTLSEETTLRKERLPFSRTVQTLRTLDLKPRFPAALQYSVVRAMKDKDSDYAKDRPQLNPIILSEMPWPELNAMTNQYLFSLSVDIMLYWLSVWIYSVLLKLILA